MSAVKDAMQRIENRAEWMKEHAEEMLEMLKDAANVLSNYSDAEYQAAKMEAEIIELVARAERAAR